MAWGDDLFKILNHERTHPYPRSIDVAMRMGDLETCSRWEQQRRQTVKTKTLHKTYICHLDWFLPRSDGRTLGQQYTYKRTYLVPGIEYSSVFHHNSRAGTERQTDTKTGSFFVDRFFLKEKVTCIFVIRCGPLGDYRYIRRVC